MERLTLKKEDRYFENEEFWVNAEQPSEDKIDDVYFKLSKFEDFMEQEEFTSIEDLKAYIKLQSKGSNDLIQENQALKEEIKILKGKLNE